MNTRYTMYRGVVENYQSDEPFELVISNNAFEHIFQLNSTITALRRLMKAGSRVAMFADPLPCRGPDPRRPAYKSTANSLLSVVRRTSFEPVKSCRATSFFRDLHT